MDQDIFKPSVYPEVCMTHNAQDTGLDVEVDLPGADKKGIELSVGNEGFCVFADRKDEKFEGCFRFGHLVDKNKAAARFDNGLLRISVPFRESVRGRRVRIE